MITCRATLDVPMDLLRFVTRLLILERRRRCTPAGSRALTCREQAVMVRRRSRARTRAAQLGRDHGISRATAYRYVDEGTPFLILDGKLFSTDRLDEKVTSVKGEAIDAWYSGKHHRPGGNLARNSLLRGLRFQGERGFALLTQRWALLRHTTTATPASSPRSSAPPRPHPIRAQIHQVKIAEITSLHQGQGEDWGMEER